jgi:hypothetical protein
MNLLERATLNDEKAEAHLSEKEIDAKIARLVRSPDAGVVAKGIELHPKRLAAQEANRPEAEPDDPRKISREMLELISPVGLAIVWAETVLRCAGWNALNLAEFVPCLASNYPEEWSYYRTLLTGPGNHLADRVTELEKGPVLSTEEIWRICTKEKTDVAA